VVVHTCRSGLLLFCSPLEQIKPLHCKLFTPRYYHRVLIFFVFSFLSLCHDDGQVFCVLVLFEAPVQDFTPVSPFAVTLSAG
jgi:hypothetical protein